MLCEESDYGRCGNTSLPGAMASGRLGMKLSRRAVEEGSRCVLVIEAAKPDEASQKVTDYETDLRPYLMDNGIRPKKA